MRRLYDSLKEYSASDYYGFHMPGHKRRMVPGAALPYDIDITEIDGFDDLHHARGILKGAQEMAARIYGAEETRFLVNGSTVGILSAILGSTNRGERILVARNCHKSVYHAIALNGLRPVYLYPGFCEDMQLNTEISVKTVKEALAEYPDIRVTVVVSPTYDGVISDIRGIADAVHEQGGLLIVDEAHGAHLGFHPYFEKNALAKGADIVIHSVHKTLPALTQTALLHVQGCAANRGKLFRYLDMLQSSSPSYVLMAGIDHCMHLLDGQAEELFEPYVRRLVKLRESFGSLKCLRLLETECYDRSKLVISVNGRKMTGRDLYRIFLEKYHLQMEMAAGTYVIAMTSVSDSPKGFARLEEALKEIDSELAKDMVRMESGIFTKGIPASAWEMPCAEALAVSDRESRTEYLTWEMAVGRVAAEYAYLYPPGSPLIVPGERVTAEITALLAQYQSDGFSIEGLERNGQIKVLRPESMHTHQISPDL